MPTFTRHEYDRMVCEGRSLPTNFTLIERNGTKKEVFLTSGAAAAVENPPLQSPRVRDALTWLSDLVDYYHVGSAERPDQTPLSDFIESGEAYKVQHDDKLRGLIQSALGRVENWLHTREDTDCADLVDKASACVAVLRDKLDTF
jgi:hypothetical protein